MKRPFIGAGRRIGRAITGTGRGVSVVPPRPRPQLPGAARTMQVRAGGHRVYGAAAKSSQRAHVTANVATGQQARMAHTRARLANEGGPTNLRARAATRRRVGTNVTAQRTARVARHNAISPPNKTSMGPEGSKVANFVRNHKVGLATGAVGMGSLAGYRAAKPGTGRNGIAPGTSNTGMYRY